MATHVGTLRELWRYPVKGMGGERLEQCAIGAAGLVGDRIWAVRDEARQELQSCKFRPQLLQCTAQTRPGADDEPGATEVRFPDGSRHDTTSATIHAAISTLVGHRSTLVPLQATPDLDLFRRFTAGDQDWLSELKATFEREPGEPLPDFDSLPPSVAEFATLPGSFFLVAPIHLVTTATLGFLQQRDPAADWDIRRFRANLVIEPAVGIAELVEQGWIGRQLRIGSAVLACTGTTPRCGAVTRPQENLGSDSSVLRTVVKHADQNVGIYATATEGEVAAGDRVYLI